MKWVFEVLRILSIKSLLLVLVSLVVMASMLMSVVGYLQAFYRFYEDLSYPPITRDKPVVVFSSYAIAPFTSVIEVDAVNQLVKDIQEVEKVLYQVLVLGYISGEAVVVRGVEPDSFGYYSGYKVVEGVDLVDNCFYCIWVGLELSRKLGLRLGDAVAIYSPFTSAPLIVEVVGVIDAGYPYNYEVITTLPLARVLRGIDSYDRYASLAIVVLSSRQGYEELARKINIDFERLSLIERAVITLRRIGKKVEFEVFSELAEVYTSRLGISRDIYLVLLLTTALVLSIGSYVVGQAIAILNADSLAILYEQGASKRWIMTSLYVILALQLVLSLYLAKVLVEYIHRHTWISMINYKISPHLSGELFIAIAIYMLSFTAMGLATVKIYDGE